MVLIKLSSPKQQEPEWYVLFFFAFVFFFLLDFSDSVIFEIRYALKDKYLQLRWPWNMQSISFEFFSLFSEGKREIVW